MIIRTVEPKRKSINPLQRIKSGNTRNITRRETTKAPNQTHDGEEGKKRSIHALYQDIVYTRDASVHTTIINAPTPTPADETRTPARAPPLCDDVEVGLEERPEVLLADVMLDDALRLSIEINESVSAPQSPEG